MLSEKLFTFNQWREVGVFQQFIIMKNSCVLDVVFNVLHYIVSPCIIAYTQLILTRNHYDATIITLKKATPVPLTIFFFY